MISATCFNLGDSDREFGKLEFGSRNIQYGGD